MLFQKCLLICNWNECTSLIAIGSGNGSWTVTYASMAWSLLLQHFVKSVHWVFLAGLFLLTVIFVPGTVMHFVDYVGQGLVISYLILIKFKLFFVF